MAKKDLNDSQKYPHYSKLVHVMQKIQINYQLQKVAFV